MLEYKETATNLYQYLGTIKNKNNKNKQRYNLLLSEYQQALFIHKQIENYCKARGLI